MSLSVCTGVPVAVEPEKTETLTVVESPAAVPFAPEYVVVRSVWKPAGGLANVSAGGVESDVWITSCGAFAASLD